MVKEKFKSLIAGAGAAALIIGGPAIAIAKTDNGNSNAGNKVTICHATGSQTNPFVKITPNANGVVSGHIGHQDANDIIPPFSYNDHGTTKQFAGQNWDATGQATFNNGCVVTTTEGGGQGGGPGEGGQVLGSNTAAVGGLGAGPAQVAAPQGSVDGGGGGASAFSLSSLNRAW
jgi:hypothetical protein